MNIFKLLAIFAMISITACTSETSPSGAEKPNENSSTELSSSSASYGIVPIDTTIRDYVDPIEGTISSASKTSYNFSTERTILFDSTNFCRRIFSGQGNSRFHGSCGRLGDIHLSAFEIGELGQGLCRLASFWRILEQRLHLGFRIFCLPMLDAKRRTCRLQQRMLRQQFAAFLRLSIRSGKRFRRLKNAFARVSEICDGKSVGGREFFAELQQKLRVNGTRTVTEKEPEITTGAYVKFYRGRKISKLSPKPFSLWSF